MPSNDIERAARDLMKRFGVAAADYARDQTMISNRRHRDRLSAEIWADIATAVDTLHKSSFGAG